MVAALMSGQVRTASELALDGAVAPSTASRHLAQLREAGLVRVARQGRHRYFHLAGAEVALKSLMGLAPPSPAGPADPALRRARRPLRRPRLDWSERCGHVAGALVAAFRTRARSPSARAASACSPNWTSAPPPARRLSRPAARGRAASCSAPR
ncbi:helix-turn-helix domain-containing protein [Xanthomonas theicola]|uniref:helix-turn-helix domain-containing protein n=1 Tax=Xanthomonas theicola TaxID=56464 RepID=UPI001FECBBE9|nr:helix-turn-helix domain-containing protein [Xanthomonas theicola]